MSLRLGTYNIRNTTDRYAERRGMLIEAIGAIGADVLGVQEVRFEESQGFGDQSADIMGAFSTSAQVFKTFLSTPFLSSDKNFRIDGNCIIVNTGTVHVISHRSWELSEVRNAQRILFRRVGFSELFSFTNVHLHHSLGSEGEELRLQQVVRTLETLSRLDAEDEVRVSFLAGDFNAPPSEKAYDKILSMNYRSLYKECNHQEPDFTFPTGIQAETMDTDPPLTADYIFCRTFADFDYDIEFVCLFGDRSHPEDVTLFPSDHIGIVAQLNIRV